MSEHTEQATVIDWRNAQMNAWPELRWLHAIPNGGKRNKVTAVKLKAEGVTPGVHDLSWPLKRHQFSGLYIEMKVRPNKPTDEQIEFLEFVTVQGFYARICYSADEAIDVIKWYYYYDGLPF